MALRTNSSWPTAAKLSVRNIFMNSASRSAVERVYPGTKTQQMSAWGLWHWRWASSRTICLTMAQRVLRKARAHPDNLSQPLDKSWRTGMMWDHRLWSKTCMDARQLSTCPKYDKYQAMMTYKFHPAPPDKSFSSQNKFIRISWQAGITVHAQLSDTHIFPSFH